MFLQWKVPRGHGLTIRDFIVSVACAMRVFVR